jgi:hypothetical protein
VRNGTLSLKKAEEVYGIAIDPTTLDMNRSETERLRGKGEKKWEGGMRKGEVKK